MEFINIPTALFSSPEYIGAEPVQRATWISLLAWCCEQENGGIIEGCRSWGMRRWMQTCGVTDQEINEENELYHFDGDHLVVFGYPHEIQETLKVKRKTARENGKLGGRPKKTNVETNIGTNAGTEEKPTSVFSETNVGTGIGTNVAPYVETYPKTVREGKERKEGKNGGKKTTTVNSTPEEEPPADPVPPPTPHESFPGFSPGTSPSYDSSAWIALQPLAEWVKTLRPGWDVSKFTGTERSALLTMHKSLGGVVPEAAKDCVSRYLAAAPANASKWDYPPDRLLFMKTFGEIVQKAFAWDRAQPRPKKKFKPEQPRQPEGPVVDTDTAAAEIRVLMKEIGLGGNEE